MARARRRRYTATMADGTRRVMLAYDGAQVDSFYRSRGYEVELVEVGDYRHTEAAASPGESWSLDDRAIQEAKEFFGIEWPVEIKLTGHRGGRFGAHTLKPTVRCHFITIKRWLSAEQASRTLWHELTHAMQIERVAKRAGATSPREAVVAWRKSPDRGTGTAYLRKPCEVEAREHEAMHDALPLTKAGR